MDVFSKEKRSKIMSQVRSQNNAATELRLISFFRRHKVTGWRRGYELFGKPDFVFPKLRVAIFVDGCFWHFCPRHKSLPAENVEFWKKKLERNRERDRLVSRVLKRAGWRVLRIWQHELMTKNEPRLLARVRRVVHHVQRMRAT